MYLASDSHKINGTVIVVSMALTLDSVMLLTVPGTYGTYDAER